MPNESKNKFEEDVQPYIRFGRFSAIISGSHPSCTDAENKVRNESLYEDLKRVTLPGEISLVVVPLGSYYHDGERESSHQVRLPLGGFPIRRNYCRDLEVRENGLFDAAFFVYPKEPGSKLRLFRPSPYRQRLVSFWETIRELGLEKYNQSDVVFFRNDFVYLIDDQHVSLRDKIRIWNINPKAFDAEIDSIWGKLLKRYVAELDLIDGMMEILYLLRKGNGFTRQ